MSTLKASLAKSLMWFLLGLFRFPAARSSYLSVPWDNESAGPIDCDPCALDTPFDYGRDELQEIPTDDDSLCMLVQMQWPRRDVSWYIHQFKRNRCGLTDFNTNTFLAASKNLQSYLKKERDEEPLASLGGKSNVEKLTWEDEQQMRKFSEEFQLHDITLIVQRATEKQLAKAFEVGERFLNQMDSRQLKSHSTNVNFEDDVASLMHQTGFKKSDPISRNAARLSSITEAATLSFKSTFKLPSNAMVGMTCFSELPSCKKRYYSLMRPNIAGHCNPDSPYRTFDGSCNNVANELWGSAFTSYRRDLPAYYSDGVCSFPLARDDKPLPSARFVSTTVNNAKSGDSASFTILHMTFGQFLDHDLTSTPISQAKAGDKDSPIKCCGVPTNSRHPECAPIEIPTDDPFYSCFNHTCMEFVRSAPAPTDDCCCLGQRQQTNVHSAYLDGSVIYGAKPSHTREARTFYDGLLKYQLSKDGEMLLPRDMEEEGKCNTQEKNKEGDYCFKAGDGRVNEQILLTFFHTMWVREHNRVARILKQLNGYWDDEKLFQETRRIIGAQLQQVTYSEFLPTIIGPTLMAVSKLSPLMGDQQTTDYDREMNAAIANNFATAAYRFGHSLITDNFIYMTKHGKVSPMEYSSIFFKPFDLYRKDGVCDVARGAIHLPEKNSDPLFSLEVSGKMFRGSKPFGLDLFALNIQRGRDHGLPPYNKWRVFCGLPKASTFTDLAGQMSLERIDALMKAYEHVDDIDLFVGAMSEKHIPGAMLGHTFTCLLHNQFLRIKYGDRYWFEYKDGPGAFTKAQVEQLHRVTLARIMCDNLPELKYIQRWPLKTPGPYNPKVCCKSIQQYTLDPWQMERKTS